MATYGDLNLSPAKTGKGIQPAKPGFAPNSGSLAPNPGETPRSNTGDGHPKRDVQPMPKDEFKPGKGQKQGDRSDSTHNKK